MAGFFQRLFRLSSAEAHGLIDKLEDPVKMTEQGIRELEKHHQESIKALAEVKAVVNKQRADLEKANMEAQDWNERAMALLSRGQSGQLPMEEAEKLARQALGRKSEAEKRRDLAQKAVDQHGQTVNRVQSKVDKLKAQIDLYKNELKTLKARSSAAKAATKLDKQLAGADPDGTVALLERMREKVEDQEALSLAYADMADRPQSLEEEIQRALADEPTPKQLTSGSQSVKEDDELAALKAQLGMN
ncbi:MAG: PspA/IM30 family protein [bacterium]|nr:PspA/IM30 family protein [bacterium]